MMNESTEMPTAVEVAPEKIEAEAPVGKVEIPYEGEFEAMGIGSEKHPATQFLEPLWQEFNDKRHLRTPEAIAERKELINRMDAATKEQLHTLIDAYHADLLTVIDAAIAKNPPIKEPISGDIAEMMNNPPLVQEFEALKHLDEAEVRQQLEEAERKHRDNLRNVQDAYLRRRFVMQDYAR